MSSPEIILMSSPDGPITAYDPFSGTVLARYIGSRSPRRGLAVVGGTTFAASHVHSDTGAGSVQLYNWWSLTCSRSVPLPEPVAPLVATLDGSYLFAGGVSGQIHAFSVTSGDVIGSFPAHEKPVSCLEVNYDGSLLISGSDDGTITVSPVFLLVDAYSNPKWGRSVLHRFLGHDSTVTGITTGTGRCDATMISCSLDCTCKMWCLVQGTHLRTVIFPCGVYESVMDPSESEFYAAGSDGLIYKGKLRVETRKRVAQGGEVAVWRKEHGGGPIVGMMTINHGRALVTASENGGIWIWEAESGNVLRGGLLGAETGSISGLVVAGGWRGDIGRRMVGGSGGCNGGWSWEKEINRPVREVLDTERKLKAAGDERSRALNNLESAFGIYEKMLKIILNEATPNSTNNVVVDDLNETNDNN